MFLARVVNGKGLYFIKFSGNNVSVKDLYYVYAWVVNGNGLTLCFRAIMGV